MTQPARREPTKGADTQERILAAADQLFGELGFEATSTRLIGERSGLNKALIHYHFSSKQQLFNAVLDRYYEDLQGVLREALLAEGDLQARLIRLLDSYVDFLAEHRRFSLMVQREIATGRHVERIVDHMLPLFETGTSLVAATYPASRSGPLAAEQLLVSFYGMVVSYFTYSPVLAGLLDTDPFSPENVARRKAHLRHMVGLVVIALEGAGDERRPEDD